MENYLQQLQQAIEAPRMQLVNHPLYNNLHTIQDVQLFAETHVYAVWDFMSLLKSLQQHLTCTTTPWQPKGNANTRYLINEIVTGEESDVDENGNRISHFELYLKAMQQMGADADAIKQLLQYINAGIKIPDALQKLHLPAAIQNFVNYTFYVIVNQPVHVQAAVFTFGREDLIPQMFMKLVQDMNNRFDGRLSTMQYYLQRHIEVDGDHHSHLALQMVAELCGNDKIKWAEATQASIKCLQKRKELWDFVNERIYTNRSHREFSNFRG